MRQDGQVFVAGLFITPETAWTTHELGGLTAAIYNEVLQFFLIVIGFTPLAWLGLKSVGGWEGLKSRMSEVAVSQGFAPDIGRVGASNSIA